MFKLFNYLILSLFLFVSSAYGQATGMWGRVNLTGGTKSVDNILYAEISDGDICIVINNSLELYFYRYESSSADAESSPDVIEPDDAAGGNGRWELFNSIVISAVDNPTITFDELTGTDWWVGIDDVGNTLEFRTNQTVGNSVQLELSESGDLVADTLSGKKVVTQVTSTPHSVTSAQVKGHWLVVTTAGDVDLPGSPEVGDNICVEQGDASETISVAVGNAAHDILLSGTLLGTNNEIDSPGGAGDRGAYICLIYTESALWRVKDREGTWVDGGAVD